MAEPARDADDGLGRLQAFVDLMRATRERVIASGEDLRARADQAADEAARVTAALRVAHDLLAARGDGLAAAEEGAGTDLAALATAAADAAQHHAAEESALEARSSALADAVEDARAAIEQAASRRDADLGEADAVLDGLQGAAAQVRTVLESVHPDLEIAAGVLSQAGLDLQAELTDAEHEVAALLHPAVEALLAGQRAHVEDRALPYVSGALDELEADAARHFADLSAAVEAAATSLARATTAALDERHAESLQLTRQHELLAREVEASAVQPMQATGDRCLATLQDAVDPCSALAALAPRLQAAREVAQQVDDMLDALNPLD